MITFCNNDPIYINPVRSDDCLLDGNLSPSAKKIFDIFSKQLLRFGLDMSDPVPEPIVFRMSDLESDDLSDFAKKLDAAIDELIEAGYIFSVTDTIKS